MRVTILRRSVATGPWRGVLGQTVEVPDDIGRLWLALNYAAPPAPAPEPSPPPASPPARKKRKS